MVLVPEGVCKGAGWDDVVADFSVVLTRVLSSLSEGTFLTFAACSTLVVELFISVLLRTASERPQLV